MDDVLLIDEKGQLAALLQPLAEEVGWRVERAKDGTQAEQWLRQRRFQALVLDLDLQGGHGEALLTRLREHWPGVEAFVVAPAGDLARGMRALRLGAYESATAPLDREQLAAGLRRTIERARLGLELRAARLREETKSVLLGDSPATVQLRQTLDKAAGHDANVLILGEAGTGKLSAARYLHQHSSRRKGPFVVLDCAAITPANMEAELFGTEAQPGQLELAGGGTVLLRHAEFLPLEPQARLLRALQDRGFAPGGSQRFVGLDARVLASASPHLRDMVKSGQFREDLFWRLGATPLDLPPLRARKEDIEDLFHSFLHERCRSLRRSTPVVRPEAIDALKGHAFPGNVSELKTLAELVAALAQEDVGLADLPIPVFVGADRESKDLPLKNIVHAFERQVILRTLKAVRGNQSRAAKRLDIHRNTLILKMQELEIPNKRETKQARMKK
jgi:two-component system nitrogen regulation response regulator NtrX